MHKIKFSGIVLIGVFSALVMSCGGGEDEVAYDETQEDYLPEAPDFETYTAELKNLEDRILASLNGSPAWCNVKPMS